MPKSEYEVLTEDLKIAINTFLEAAKGNREFKAIYNKAMNAYRVLNTWAPDNQELLGSAAGISKRVIALVSIRQYSLVNLELRRFIECIIWYIYFADHPVECEVFKRNPSRSWQKKPEKPIESAASSPINFYLRYVEERFSNEPSGLANSAIGTFRNQYDTLSTNIHGGKLAIDGTLALIYDREDPAQHKGLKNSCYKIFKSGCILIAALKVHLLEDLSTTDRRCFDSLVSPSTARKIRIQPFGLQQI